LRRVVVTGIGIVSSLGNNANEVEASLKSSKSGIWFQPEYEEHGLRSQIAGSINISVEELIEADLLIKNKNDNFFGRFRDRITFPIFNHQDKIVGFGGRTINNSKIKYINSQESEIFKKSEILFGLKQNINQIRESKEIILKPYRHTYK